MLTLFSLRNEFQTIFLLSTREHLPCELQDHILKFLKNGEMLNPKDTYKIIRFDRGAEGIDLGGLNLSGLDLSDLCFKGVFFDDMSLVDVDFTRTIFNQCYFRRGSFKRANLIDSKFLHSFFYEWEMNESDFTGSDFSSTILQKSKTSGCYIKPAGAFDGYMISYPEKCLDMNDLSERDPIHGDVTIGSLLMAAGLGPNELFSDQSSQL